MGTWKKIKKRANKVVDRYLSEPVERFGEAFDSGKLDGSYDANIEGARLERSQAAQAADLVAREEQLRLDAMTSLEKDRKRRAKIKGRSSTILTSPLGAIGGDIQKKMLLGA